MARILVADDYEPFRIFLKTLLERHDDWSVCGVATNGDEAVQKAIKLKPAVILVDIEMPKLDGLSACRLIREKVPTSEIIILTVYQSIELARIAAESGAQGYVSKSLISKDLIGAIEAMMSDGPAQRQVSGKRYRLGLEASLLQQDVLKGFEATVLRWF